MRSGSRIGRRWLFLLAALSAITTGCVRESPSASRPATAPTTSPGVALPTTASLPATVPTTSQTSSQADPPIPSKVPVVYTHYGRHRTLTAEQERLILEVVVRWEKPADCKLWFIGVHYIGDLSVWADAYYEPDAVSPRLRKGRSTRVYISKESEIVERKEPAGKRRIDVVFGKNDRVTSSRPATYVQVSQVAEPYTAELTTPAPVDLPFPTPGYPPALTGGGPVRKLSDPELVSLIDFIRAEYARKEVPPADEDDPICWVIGNGADVFGVAVGVSDWGGHAFHVRVRDGRFEVINEVGWADADTVAWPPPQK